MSKIEKDREKTESKIKSASEFIEGYPERLSNAQYRYIIYAIVEAKRQAIEATLENEKKRLEHQKIELSNLSKVATSEDERQRLSAKMSGVGLAIENLRQSLINLPEILD